MTTTDDNAEPGHASRIALGIEYDGRDFSGWQKQAAPELPTVQGALESALANVADHPVSLVCAGRTDTGVHATGQVVHFDCAIDRGAKAWIRGSNSQLPYSVRVTWAQTVSNEFHARFSAMSRRYLYVLYVNPVASAIAAGQITHVTSPLNVAAMHEAAQFLLGEQDFSAFQAAGCQSSTPFRNVHWLKVQQHREFIVVDIQANAFLQHMVRNIVGMLLEVGQGRQSPAWAQELLQQRDRTLGAMTAPADGLYLVDVRYPEKFTLPTRPTGPLFLQPY